MPKIKKKKKEKSLYKLTFDSREAEHFYNSGINYHKQGILDQAISSYHQALNLNPKHDMALYCLGIAMQDKESLDEAEDCYKRAIILNPNNAMAHHNLGFILQKRQQTEEAIHCYKRALEIKPEFHTAINNLGNAFSDFGRIDDAISQHEKALKLNPNYSHAYHSLGNALEKKGEISQAINHYKKAIQINPHLIEAHWDLSHALLKSGNFQRGWKEYEWRWQLKDFGWRNFPQPLWDGSSLNRRKIFVYTEQGIGDVIMFASCLPEIIEEAEMCTVECDKRLVPLFARSFPKANFIQTLQEGDMFPSDLLSYDVKIPIASMPKFLRQDLGSFPEIESYLIPDKQQVAKWKSRFSEIGKGLKIGISWIGGKYPSVRRERSIVLEKWVEFLSLKGIHFINLQYGDCSDELKEIQKKTGTVIHDWEDSDPLKDLDDFSAKIEALDLVISVDNSTAHMAGALGVPVWTLLPFNCDWRWMYDYQDTPWYKMMRLFRQNKSGEWDSVINNISQLISGFMDSEYLPKIDAEYSYKKPSQKKSISIETGIETTQNLNIHNYPNNNGKIAILLTTFLRDELMFKTVKTIIKHWQDRFIVLIADQGCENDAEFNDKEAKLHDLFKDQSPFRYIRLPFDCGLSAARNYLVKIADNMNMQYCLLTADSIQFIERYDLDPVISFLEQDTARGMVGFYLYGGNRTSWQRDLDLVEGEYFYLKIPQRNPIEYQGVVFQPVDICDNFFLAKTACLIRNPWDETLKLSEHEDFFWRLKNNNIPCQVFWTYDIRAQYTHEKRHDYLKMRNRIYDEFRTMLQKKYNLREWIKYEE